MPVGAVGRSASGERSRRLDERAVSGRVPEANLVGGKVDLVRYVVPFIGDEFGFPLALAANHPLPVIFASAIHVLKTNIHGGLSCVRGLREIHIQVGVAGARLAADPAILELGEVAFEERYLVLVGRARGVGVGALDGEVVEDGALVDGGFGLRNQFCPPHVAVPLCRVVDGDLGSLLAARVAGVLVVGREVDWVKSIRVSSLVYRLEKRTVSGGRPRAVDVVLVVCGKGYEF